MARWSACVGFCLLFALSFEASAQERPRSSVNARAKPRDLGVPPPSEINPILRERISSFVGLKRLLSTREVECVAGAGGVCPPIWIQLVTATDASGNIFCGGLIAEKVRFTGTPANEKTLVWALIPDPQNPNAKIEFHKDHGILVLADDNSQLRGGKLGDGSSGPADATRFTMRNKHRVKQTAVYVPVILSKDAAGKISICATPDPLIVNE